jgi:HEAT repeat protein
MTDPDADVKVEALSSWILIRQQQGAAPAIDLIGDTDARVRAKAAGVCGSLREAGCRVALEAQLATDSEPTVRRNAAWALGRIGDSASKPALVAAENDPSDLVRLTAKAAASAL